MSEVSEFFKGLDQQIERNQFQLNLNNDSFKSFITEQEQKEKAILQKEKEEEQKKQQLKDIANNIYNPLSGKLKEDTPENKAFLDYFTSQMEESIKNTQYTISKENKREIDSIKTLQDYTYKRIIEAKARRTTAIITEDFETRTSATSEINKLEKELSDYTERLNELLKGN